jgi:hypothetical protein
MTGEERDRRDSRALEPELIKDPRAKAVAEARNGFRQYDVAMEAVHTALDRGSFNFARPSFLVCNGKRLSELAPTRGTIVQAALLLKAANMNPSARTWSPN